VPENGGDLYRQDENAKSGEQLQTVAVRWENPEPEVRNPNPPSVPLAVDRVSNIRASDFFRISAFGFRILKSCGE
jgi:hypothetical protein